MNRCELKDGREVFVTSGQKVDPEALERFYRSSFPERAARLSTDWKWLCRSTYPQGQKSPILVVSPRGTVVGYAGLIPVTVGWRDRRVEAKWFIDYFTLPEYRGMGVGSVLIREVMRAAPLLLGTGSNANAIPILLYFGWRQISETHQLTLPLRPSVYPRVSNTAARYPARLLDMLARPTLKTYLGSGPGTHSVSPVDGNLLEEWGREHEAAHRDHARVIQDDEYLHWRITSYPFGGDFTLHDTQFGQALARTFWRTPSCRQTNILGVHGSDVARTCKEVVRWCLVQGVDLVSFVCSDPKVLRALRWLFPVHNGMAVRVYAEDPALVDGLVSCPQAWEFMDSDLDLGYFEVSPVRSEGGEPSGRLGRYGPSRPSA